MSISSWKDKQNTVYPYLDTSVMVVQPCVYSKKKNHLTVYFQMIHFMLHELYVNLKKPQMAWLSSCFSYLHLAEWEEHLKENALTLKSTLHSGNGPHLPELSFIQPSEISAHRKSLWVYTVKSKPKTKNMVTLSNV